MGLFEKKFCDICGQKISFLGNHKLEDGNMCSACNKKMSPYFSGRRKTTIAEMKEHLAEREANVAKVAAFNVNDIYGEGKKVYIDRAKGNFMVTSCNPGNFEKENPDVIPLSDVKYCNIDVRERKEEEKYRDNDGTMKSFNPPRYRFFYTFHVTIGVNSRWFDEIGFDLNQGRVEGYPSVQYHQYENMGNELKAALTGQPVAATANPMNPYATAAAPQFANPQYVNPQAQAPYGVNPNAQYAPNGQFVNPQAQVPYGVDPNAQYAPNGQFVNPQAQVPYGVDPNAQYAPNGQFVNPQAQAPYGAAPNAQYAPNGQYGNPQAQAPYGVDPNAQYAPNGQFVSPQAQAPYGAAPNAQYAPNGQYANPQYTNPQAVQPQAPVQEQAQSSGPWKCPFCGNLNLAAFCGNCGAQRPAGN